MNPPSQVATLFDFNGVLVDDEHVHLASFREVLAPLGIQLTDAAYAEKYLGFDDRGAFRAILEDEGRRPTDQDVERLVEAKKPVYIAHIRDNLRIFPGAADLVRRRAERGLVGIVSGALRHEIDYCLQRMGVSDLVAFVVAAEDTTACKPDPEGYALGQKALSALVSGLPLRTVALEDSVAGVRAAKAAQLRCVAVTHSYPREALSEADAIVDSLAELTDAVLDGWPR